MRILLAILLTLPMVAQTWDAETVVRPTTKSARDVLKAERVQLRARSLGIGEPAEYEDKTGKWYVVSHHGEWLLAVRDKALLTEITCLPVYSDGRHDEAWLDAYLEKLIQAGEAKRWSPKPAVYDAEGEVVTPAILKISDGWTTPSAEPVKLVEPIIRK